jgi:hypothetical protein
MIHYQALCDHEYYYTSPSSHLHHSHERLTVIVKASVFMTFAWADRRRARRSYTPKGSEQGSFSWVLGGLDDLTLKNQSKPQS